MENSIVIRIYLAIFSSRICARCCKNFLKISPTYISTLCLISKNQDTLIRQKKSHEINKYLVHWSRWVHPCISLIIISSTNRKEFPKASCQQHVCDSQALFQARCIQMDVLMCCHIFRSQSK